MFDITSEAVEDTATIHLKGATGELLYANNDRTKPVQIVVYGPGSEAFAAVEARQTARAVKRMQENDGKVVGIPHEERRDQSAEDLAALTVRFVNLAYPPAGDAEGPALFAALYRDPKIGFVTKQVSQAVTDWGKFKAA